MEADCIFCRIAAGEVPATIAHRDDEVIAFTDANPQAPTHVLVLPVEHFANLAALSGSKPQLLAKLMGIAAMLGTRAGGYRVVINTGADGGQAVDHVHVHVLAGRRLTWPPG